ncbi:MAG: hypothetical protein PHC39_04945 [Proteiniphilum sp.]|nr:hypothetical protein [Proteiniphilum sp.]
MSLPVQISLNKKRLTQLDVIKASRPDCSGMLIDDIAKKLLFEKIDECAGAIK